MSESTIERVARAIYEEDDPWHTAFPWPNLNEKQTSPDAYRRIARAAIEAMREPTAAMVSAGSDEMTNGKNVWHAMIDTILKGEGR